MSDASSTPPKGGRASGFRGGLAVLSGPSGSGKTSICKALLEDPRVVLSISATTRRPRTGEKDGVDYWFYDQPTFLRMRDAGEFIEWAQVYGNLYGTPKKPLEEASRRTDRLMLLDIDVQGAAQLRKQGIAATYLFVAPPSMKVLEQRLTARATDPPDVIRRRLAVAEQEMLQRGLYDEVLVNEDLAATIRKAKSLLGLAADAPA
jgi:guanylate kinase